MQNKLRYLNILLILLIHLPFGKVEGTNPNTRQERRYDRFIRVFLSPVIKSLPDSSDRAV
jgi:hypothetical protein